MVETISRQARARQERDLWALGVLPMLAVGSVAGLLGVYWDIAWHIDKGRDSFFSPPHNLIYAFMLIVLTMSLYGLVRDRRETPFHLRLGRVRLHPGLLIVALGAMLVLFFAPADELWHRVFGPDATLWGPMHLIGLLGFTMATFGGLLSSWLERSLTPKRQRLFSLTTLFFAIVLLAWTVLYLAEFEYGIQFFPIFWYSLLLTGLPTFALVLIAKLNPFPWAATLTAFFFSVLRLLLSGFLMTTAYFDLAGDNRPHIPLLLFTGLAADLLVQRKVPLWLTGLLLGAITFFSNYYQHQLNWYTNSIMVGLPLGLVLSVTLVFLAAAVATALPTLKQVKQ